LAEAEAAPEFAPEDALAEFAPRESPAPLPSPPVAIAAEPAGDMATVAFSAFGGTPGFSPGRGETTTPAAAESDALLSLASAELLLFSGDEFGGGITRASEPRNSFC